MSEVTRHSSSSHCVAQNGLMRVDYSQHNTTTAGDNGTERTWQLNGDTTRIYDKGRFGNIVKGRRRDHEFVLPHMLPLHHQYYNVPLSTYLCGDGAIAADPSAKWTEGLKLDREYLGTCNVDGDTCHKIACTTRLESGKQFSRWEFALSEDKNYLPVRVLTFCLVVSATIPEFQCKLGDFRELKPGIWFPFVAECMKYDESTLLSEGRQALRWRRDYLVEQASLQPQYEAKYFNDIDFPSGLPIYEIEGGEVVKSYRKDASPGATATGAGRGSIWWVVAINAAVIAIALYAIARKRSAGSDHSRSDAAVSVRR